MRTQLAVVVAAIRGLWSKTPVLRHAALLPSALLAGLLLIPAASPSAEPDAKALYVDKGCSHCHGEDGRTTQWDTTPIIAGQKPRYVYLVLRAYKTGERKGVGANQHAEVNDVLSDKEMHLLADYVSSLK
ncbi:MAG TPA: c-type cytochrome [bacterium]|nr:c-type cytochrome [bacterium]